jgi:hypothetical protein
MPNSGSNMVKDHQSGQRNVLERRTLTPDRQSSLSGQNVSSLSTWNTQCPFNASLAEVSFYENRCLELGGFY